MKYNDGQHFLDTWCTCDVQHIVRLSLKFPIAECFCAAANSDPWLCPFPIHQKYESTRTTRKWILKCIIYFICRIHDKHQTDWFVRLWCSQFLRTQTIWQCQIKSKDASKRLKNIPFIYVALCFELKPVKVSCLTRMFRALSDLSAGQAKTNIWSGST